MVYLIQSNCSGALLSACPGEVICKCLITFALHYDDSMLPLYLFDNFYLLLCFIFGQVNMLLPVLLEKYLIFKYYNFISENMLQSAVKASVAAAVTVLLILVCVLADCISKWRIQQRINKAAAASGEQPLLKNIETEDAADVSNTEQVKKKEQP